MTTAHASLTSNGHALDLSPSAFGELTRSDDCLNRPDHLRQRLDRDGYLYMPGFFERDDIMAVRASLTESLSEKGYLNPDYPHLEAVAALPDQKTGINLDLALNNQILRKFVFGEQLLGFYEAFFGEPIRHFDFIWTRAINPGLGSQPHCDLVYMGRGTPDLLTCWIPYGDVSLDLGGLIVLEESHRKSERISAYLNKDVDSYCENRSDQVKKVKEEGGWSHPGWLSTNPASLREKLGGRWLTTDWKAGDFITFKMNLVHGSLDNNTDRIRLSSDTRYQKASEPIDPRWIGSTPSGHSRAGKQGRIC